MSWMIFGLWMRVWVRFKFDSNEFFFSSFAENSMNKDVFGGFSRRHTGSLTTDGEGKYHSQFIIQNSQNLEWNIHKKATKILFYC